MDKTAASLNRVLDQAGVDPSNLTVLSCKTPRGFCEVQIQENQKTRKESFSLEDFFVFVNQDFLSRQPSAAKNRKSNTQALFRPISRDWVLLDTDGDPGVEGILHFQEGEWELSPGWVSQDTPLPVLGKILKLAEVFLSTEERKQFAGFSKDLSPLAWVVGTVKDKDWSDAGLTATPGSFESRSYPFAVDVPANTPTFLSPFHRVTLKGQPKIEIPWTDPYLLMEWHAFLRRNGVKIRQIKPREDILVTEYEYRGFPFLRSQEDGRERVFRWLSPLGEIRDEISLPLSAPTPLEIQSENKGKNYRIQLGKETFQVTALLPEKFPEEKREAILRQVGDLLQQIPKSYLAPFHRGTGEERPIRFYLSDKETAVKNGWLNSRHSEIAAATYNAGENRVWLGISEDAKLQAGVLFHEVAGHALADFEVPGDDAGHLVGDPKTAFNDYFRWKLTQLFSPEELKTYADLSRRYAVWKQGDKKDATLGKNLEGDLAPFREKAQRRFVSNYSVEGPDGIQVHLKSPEEDFAEVMMVWMECLTGGKDWAEYRDREPLLQLAGLHYLFKEYGVDRIGELSAAEVFSQRGFQEIADIQFGGSDTVLRESGLFPTPKPRSWFAFPLTLGIQNILMADGERTWTPWLGIQGGYHRGNIRAGINLDFYAGGDGLGSLPILDGGVWFRLSQKVAGLPVFWEPSLGMRASLEGEGSPSIWMGNRAGVEMFGGKLALVVDQKTGLSNFGEAMNFGFGLRLTLFSH